MENAKPAENEAHEAETEEPDDDDETDSNKRYTIKSEFTEVEGDIQVKADQNDNQEMWDALHSPKEWTQLGLSQNLLNAIAELNYKKPSKIQGIAITSILRKPYKNFIGQAQSGTGKTASFLLSMLSRIDPAVPDPQILCLAPTRELVRQIFSVGQKLAKYTTILFGLAIPSADKRALKEFHHQIIIGTPGTVNFLLEKGKVPLNHIKMIVIDEADEMFLKQGEDQQAPKIIKKFKNIQICLFSATYNDKVREFIRQFIHNPLIEISVPVEKLSLHALKQYYIDCKKEEYKLDILEKFYSHVTVGQSIIFTQTRYQATIVKDFLKKQGHEVSMLHGGGKVFKLRDNIIDSFKQGASRILVTTNLLARGVDVLQVSLVVNYDLPLTVDKTPDYETYLHRIGRSARYGKPGLAINLVHDENSKQILAKITDHYKREILPLDESSFDELDNVMALLAKHYQSFKK